MLEVETHYLNVGQGDCSLILVRDKSKPKKKTYDNQIVRAIVYDCGSSGGSLPAAELLRKCQYLKVETIHLAIVSHFDTDHFLGFTELLGKTTEPDVIRLFQNTVFCTVGLAYKLNKMKLKSKSGKFSKQKVATAYQYPEKLNKKNERMLLPSIGPYVKFLKALYNFSNANGNSLIHWTERVFSGFPDLESTTINPGGTYLVHKDEWFPTKDMNTTDSTKFKDYKEIIFQPGNTDYILGKDLMNIYSEDKDKIDAHLYCLSYNRDVVVDFDPDSHVLKKAGVKDAGVANSKSLGCLLQLGNYTAWFGGDLPSTEEDQIIQSILNVAQKPNKKKKIMGGLTILKAGHHGADESSSKPFIKAVMPKATIITCGAATHPSEGLSTEKGQHGEFGHPGPRTMERLIDWYTNLFEKESNPDYAIYTTWMSRNRVFNGTWGIDYLSPEGTDSTYITHSDIRVIADETGKFDIHYNSPEFIFEPLDKSIGRITSYSILERKDELIKRAVKKKKWKYDANEEIESKMVFDWDDKKRYRGKITISVKPPRKVAKRKFEDIEVEGEVDGRKFTKKRRLE